MDIFRIGKGNVAITGLNLTDVDMHGNCFYVQNADITVSFLSIIDSTLSDGAKVFLSEPEPMQLASSALRYQSIMLPARC